MIEPEFLTATELAERWKPQTPRQIIEHGAGFKLPLYFFFSGLAIDSGDDWHRDRGSHGNLQQQSTLRDVIANAERQIRRNASGVADKFDALTSDEVIALRNRINGWRAELQELDQKLQVREFERRGFEYRGILRLLPDTMIKLMASAEVSHPHFAYHPLYPLSQVQSKDGLVLEGRLMALEPAPGMPWKAKLTRDDVLVRFSDVKAAESPADAANTPRPMQRQEAQGIAIIEALKGLGYDPKSLPPFQPGKRGAKAHVWDLLIKKKDIFRSKGVFDKAWDRLKAGEELAYQPSSP
ncbi:hypothetical protein ACAW63_10980 [Pseudomonas sp. QE6]|uniref:hypothetical protein n=1 Tax=Pseudomonas sp. QE6 TaxID=3242491 RepID=UPI003526D830